KPPKRQMRQNWQTAQTRPAVRGSHAISPCPAMWTRRPPDDPALLRSKTRNSLAVSIFFPIVCLSSVTALLALAILLHNHARQLIQPITRIAVGWIYL